MATTRRFCSIRMGSTHSRSAIARGISFKASGIRYDRAAVHVGNAGYFFQGRSPSLPWRRGPAPASIHRGGSAFPCCSLIIFCRSASEIFPRSRSASPNFFFFMESSMHPYENGTGWIDARRSAETPDICMRSEPDLRYQHCVRFWNIKIWPECPKEEMAV